MMQENIIYSTGDLVWIREGFYNADGDFDKFVGPGLLLDKHPCSIQVRRDYWTVAASGGIGYCFEDGLSHFTFKVAV